MTVSITIDSVEINGSDGRRLHGQISDTNIGGTTREVSISGLLTGTDVADLQDKWQTAKDVCNTRDKHCVISIDGTASGFLEEFFTGDGKTTGIITYITGDTTRIGTATTMPFTIFITVSEVITIPTGSGLGAPVVEFEGQVGEWRLMKVLSDARTESRILTITFGLIYDETALGPFNFVSVANLAGKADFQFGAGDLAGITFAAGMKLIVSSSTNYDATHVVTAVDTGTDIVTTETVFTSTDTGTATIGTVDTPQEVYDASRTGLLTLLGVGTDGTRDSTTGLVLTNETIEDKGDLLTTVLNAEWVEKSYDDDVRNFQIALNTSELPDWPEDAEAGERPMSINAVVSFSVDKVQATTDDVNAMWSTIRASVIADIKSNSNATGIVGPLDEGISWDKKAGTVGVNLSFIAQNTTVFAYSRVTSTHEELDYNSWKDADGFDIIQTGAEPTVKLTSVTVTRTGVNVATLTVTPPSPGGGYRWIELSSDDSISNPIDRKEVGAVYTQTLSKVFKRFKLRAGGDPRRRTPTTG